MKLFKSIAQSLVVIGASSLLVTLTSAATCNWSEATNDCNSSACGSGTPTGTPVIYQHCVSGTPAGTCCECEEKVYSCTGGGFAYVRTKSVPKLNPCIIRDFSPFFAECTG